MQVGPLGFQKGVRKQVRMSDQAGTPVPRLHPGIRCGAGREDGQR